MLEGFSAAFASPNPAGLVEGSRWVVPGWQGERPPVRGGQSVCIPEGCQTTDFRSGNEMSSQTGRAVSGTSPRCIAIRASIPWSAPVRPDRPPATFWQPCQVDGDGET